MPSPRRFPSRIICAIGQSKILGIRTGSQPHRFIGIWAVVAQGRVFVRSWDQKPDGWYRVLRQEPYGIIQIADRELRIRAVQTRSEGVKDAVDRAYAEKYTTPGALKYVRGFKRLRRRATTTELMPA
jgi:hypothetical protein